uniref:Ovule protein n=1 Tax=Ascaris lumbricoides TaxID=6252 RepID=A0A0M3HV79_ASCLU
MISKLVENLSSLAEDVLSLSTGGDIFESQILAVDDFLQTVSRYIGDIDLHFLLEFFSSLTFLDRADERILQYTGVYLSVVWASCFVFLGLFSSNCRLPFD